jgi:periplasmic divalent cation tolerance protein
MERPLLVYTTFPDQDTALSVGRELVAEKLAACINVLPGMKSVYAWKGAIETGDEVVAIVKTRQDLKERVRAALKARHPYETPIILFLDVSGGDQATLDWLLGETGAHPLSPPGRG